MADRHSVAQQLELITDPDEKARREAENGIRQFNLAIHPFADGNGRTARAVSYVVLSIKLDSLLPGVPTIPDQISEDKEPYYKALEVADEAWKSSGHADVSALEAMIEVMLAKQLVAAASEAAGAGRA